MRLVEYKLMKAMAAAVPCVLACLAFVEPASAQANGSWWDEHVSMSADARLRYQSTEVAPGDDDERERYRARFGAVVEPGKDLEFGLRFATGGDDPASTNLDFGESFSLDKLRVDQLYLSWTWQDVLEFTGGKMRNPIHRAGGDGLIWDGDLTPEGMAAEYSEGALFSTVGGFIFADRVQGPEVRLYAAQAGGELPLPGAGSLLAGMGWYDFRDVAGLPPLFGDNPRGNSVDAAGNYRHDYDILEVFAEYRREVRGWPVTVFGNWAKNTRAPANDTAYSIGVIFNGIEEPGDFELSWAWRDTEADALIGILTDSDMAGGNTDSRGHVFGASYQATRRIGFGAALSLAERGLSTGTTTDFDRLQLDIEFSF